MVPFNARFTIPECTMIYLAAPYSHPNEAVREERYLDTCRFLVSHAREGCFLYSPIVHWHHIAVHWKLPTDWPFWERQCLPMLEKADELWVLCLPGWLNSKGVTAETTYWREELKREHVALHCPDLQ